MPLFVLILLLTLTGCARTIDPNVYEDMQVGEVADTFQAVVLSVRPVTVKASDDRLAGGWGTIVGGTAGGFGANNIGKGSGRAAATLGGVAVGAAIGSLVNNELSKQPGLEYIIKYWDTKNVENVQGELLGSPLTRDINKANERLLTLIQGPQSQLQIGQKVFLIITPTGRARLIADQSGEPQVNQRVIDQVTTD